jgi:hypothetical protein
LAHWRILRDWKQSKFFREHGVYNTSDEMKDWVHNPAHWRHLIERFGGAPGHLFTPHSYLQAVELAHELAARTRYRLRVIDALRGLAFAVCEAHRAGDDIRSLGFIGAHLAGKILKDELAWAFAFQTRLSTERHDAVLSFALRWIAALEKVNWSLHKDSLLSTFELEELDRILASCKNDETAVWKALGGGKPAEEGKSVCGWWWWSEQIEQLQKEQKPAKRRRRSNCLGSWPR